MSHIPSLSDTFRINMKLGFGAHSPTSPAPIPPATQWWDVSNWQTFFMEIGLLGAGYPTNVFDSPTQMATKSFQSSAQWGTPVLAATGIVNQATYQRAVANGMPAYPTVITT